jgi:hypothetical protein
MNNDLPRALVIVGVVLALGMSAAAFIFGVQAKHIGASKQSIAVKGLAEKAVTADLAEWSINTEVKGATFAEALKQLRSSVPVTKQFLINQGFAAELIKEESEQVVAHMEEEEGREGRVRYVQKGYRAGQSITVTTKELDKVLAASKALVQFQADGHPVSAQPPMFMVSNLEDIKMSLIGAATQNAQKRAEEFAKHGNTKVGAMRFASQGAFYILPAGASQEINDYGGTYDKSTIDKTARVVVTIEYNIDK